MLFTCNPPNLAVTDVLYKHRDMVEAESEVNGSSEESDDEDEDKYDEYEEPFSYICNQEHPIPILSDNCKHSVSQIRKICKFFRNSPVRNTILQNYIKLKKGKELNLILDCKTRWNSIEEMVGRFLAVKECVVLALNDLGSSYMWNEAQYPTLLELHKVMEPIRLAVEGSIFSLLLNELKNIKSKISLNLLKALEERIQERRQVELASLLLFLQNPENISGPAKKSSILPLASKTDIIKLSERLLSTIFQNSIINTASDQEEIEETTHQSKAFLKEVMENSINKLLEEPAESITNPKTLRAEF